MAAKVIAGLPNGAKNPSKSDPQSSLMAILATQGVPKCLLGAQMTTVTHKIEEILTK